MKWVIKFQKLVCLLLIISCSSNDIIMELEQQALNKMLFEIRTMANSKNCINPENWQIIDYVHKACGGAMGYIAYSNKIQVDRFLEKIELLKKTQKEFNRKWGVTSDCSIPVAPIGIICENNKAKLIYE